MESEYVLVCEVREEFKYYVQHHNGSYRLNGLINNAVKYEDERAAILAIPNLKDRTGWDLYPMPFEAKLI